LGSAIDGGIGEGRHRPVTADEPTAGASRRGGGPGGQLARGGGPGGGNWIRSD
jgi:hypothetical protein